MSHGAVAARALLWVGTDVDPVSADWTMPDLGGAALPHEMHAFSDLVPPLLRQIDEKRAVAPQRIGDRRLPAPNGLSLEACW